MTNVGEDVAKSEPSYIAGGNVNGATALENCLAVPQIVKHRVTISPRNSTSMYILK